MHLSRYWNIIFYRTLAGIKAESRQNYLGYFWYLLQPILSTTIFYFAFTKVMGRGGKEYIMFLLIGLTAWQWFEGTCLEASNAIKAKLHILQHFDLPKFLFPIVTVLINTWKIFCIFLVLIVSGLVMGYLPNLNYCFLPVIFGCELLLILSLAIPLAVATTYFNDTTTLAMSVFRIGFFVSGIYFDSTKVPPSLLGPFYANPMAGIIESYRHVLLNNLPPNWGALLYGTMLSGVGLGLGLLLCHYVNRRILKHASL